MNTDRDFLTDPVKGEEAIRQLLSYRAVTPPLAELTGHILSTAAFNLIAGLVVSIVGAFIFSLDKTQTVYVFCASFISFSCSTNDGVLIDDPRTHIANSTKAIAIMQHLSRRKQKLE